MDDPKLCSIYGCYGKHSAKGMCHKHYKAQWRRENGREPRELPQWGDCANCFTPVARRQPNRWANTFCSWECRSAHRKKVPYSCDTGRTKRGYGYRKYALEVYKRDAWICWLCGDPVDVEVCVPDPTAPTLDHVMPVSHGGTDDPENLATAHFSCNVRRGAKAELVTLSSPLGA